MATSNAPNDPQVRIRRLAGRIKELESDLARLQDQAPEIERLLEECRRYQAQALARHSAAVRAVEEVRRHDQARIALQVEVSRARDLVAEIEERERKARQALEVGRGLYEEALHKADAREAALQTRVAGLEEAIAAAEGERDTARREAEEDRRMRAEIAAVLDAVTAERDAQREALDERAAKIADLRALIARLDQHPEPPNAEDHTR